MDRQDRYTWFRNVPQLADYFAELVTTTASHSFTLRDDGSTENPTSMSVNPLNSRQSAQEYRTSMNKAVTELVQREHTTNDLTGELRDKEGPDTVVFPLIQMGYYGIRQDEQVTESLFQELEDGDQLCLASGYFNLPPSYVDAILKGRGEYNILAASPQVRVTILRECRTATLAYTERYTSVFHTEVGAPWDFPPPAKISPTQKIDYHHIKKLMVCGVVKKKLQIAPNCTSEHCFLKFFP